MKRILLKYVFPIGLILLFLSFAVPPGVNWINEVQSTIIMNQVMIDSLEAQNKRYQARVVALEKLEKDLIKELERSLRENQRAIAAWKTIVEKYEKSRDSLILPATAEDSLVLKRLENL